MRALTITAAMLGISIAACASTYEPTEGWPYLYEEFVPATVYYRNDDPARAQVNVHLVANSLHFIDGEDIKAAANLQYIDSVVCDNNTVLERKGGLFVERIYSTPHVLVGTTCCADLNTAGSAGGAYGMSTVSSSTRDVADGRDYGNVMARKYNEMVADRHNSASLPVIRRITIVTDTDICNATKNGVNGILYKEERDAFKAFLKANKIKWKEPESLRLVADFLEGIMAQRAVME